MCFWKKTRHRHVLRLELCYELLWSFFRVLLENCQSTSGVRRATTQAWFDILNSAFPSKFFACKRTKCFHKFVMQVLPLQSLSCVCTANESALKCAVVCWRCYKHDWKNMKKKNYTNEQAISILVVRWPHISSIITDSSNSQTTQQPNAVGNNSRNWNSIFHSFRMWREGVVYCRLTRQRSYLHCWFLVFFTRTFLILLCFFPIT